MSEVPVSLIVPVYNAEKTLPALFACIDAQVLESFEVIFVDDGSTDCSLELLQEYATSRQNVIIVTQKHSGPGPARNAGLRIAQGAYITFADADDTFTPDFLYASYLHALATSSDFVVFDFEQRFTSGEIEKKRPSPSFREATSLNRTASWRTIPSRALHFILPSVFCKLWKKSFLNDNGLIFLDLCFSEDVVFTMEAFLAATRISYLPMTLYIRDGSAHANITGTFSGSELLACVTAWEHIVDILSSAEEYRPLCVSAVRRLVSPQLWHKERYAGDWSDEESREYVMRLHTLLNSQYFSEISYDNFQFSEWGSFFTVMRDGKPAEILKALSTGGIDYLLSVSTDLVERGHLDGVQEDFSMRGEHQSGDNITANSAVTLMPTTVRIDAATLCQLRCTGCGFQKSGGRGLGLGYLSFENFKAFVDENPRIERVELSNYGEIFLNPDLIKILAYAHEKGVALEAAMGVNFNAVTDEQIQALIDYEFRFLSFSIDGASQESYSQYRIRGNFDTVISNVRRLQDAKKARGALYPKVQWQFVPNQFNEDEILEAKALAKELDVPIMFKLNFIGSYVPKDPDRLKAETGLAEATRKEYLEVHKIPYLNDDCLQVFLDPQFNWDGTLLGCCRNELRIFESNLFRDGLEACLRDEGLVRMKELLLSPDPDPSDYGNLPCLKCALWKARKQNKQALELPSVGSLAMKTTCHCEE